MDTRSPLVLVAVIAAILLLSSGCGQSLPEFEGTLTWNGKPVEQGYIEFTPLDGAGQVTGVSVSNGQFKIRSAPGLKKVSVRGKRKVGEKPANERIPVAEAIFHQYIPAKFNSQTELNVALKTDDPLVVLDLEGEEIEYVPAELPAGRKDNY